MLSTERETSEARWWRNSHAGRRAAVEAVRPRELWRERAGVPTSGGSVFLSREQRQAPGRESASVSRDGMACARALGAGVGRIRPAGVVAWIGRSER